AAGQAVYCSSSVSKRERRYQAGTSRRRNRRGNNYGSGTHTLAVGDRAQFDLGVRRPHCRCEADRSRTWARYVLEGSVRKEGNRVRVTGQLIDAATGAHLWADRFEGEVANLFDLQDEVTESVVGAIAPELQQAEIERARRKRTESLDAYD